MTKKNKGDWTMQSHKQKAFTLVEIMIVMAIIGILAMIAVPAYNDFTIRSKVSEGFTLASNAKTSVMEYYMTKGNWPSNNAVAGMPSADKIKGEFVKSVAVNGDQVIVTFNENAGDDLANHRLMMTAKENTGSISWSCKGADIENKFLPPNCRDANKEDTDKKAL